MKINNLINFLLVVFSPNCLVALLPNSLLRRRNGQMALMMVLTTLMFLLIMVPVIERFVQNEGKWSMKNRKTSLAFNLAEAGVDRAYWKLIENTDNWDIIEQGGIISGYVNDKEYEDIDGGTYKINMIAGDNDREIIVIGTGKDFSSKEYRAIKVVYSKEAIQAALQAPVISGTGNANIYWGPVMSLSSLDLSGGANELFPRKYARTSITGDGTYDDRDISKLTTPNKGPYTDNVFTEWWSYNEPPGVPDILTPDTSYYKQLAIDQEAFTGLNLYVDDKAFMNSVQDSVCTVDLGLGNGPEPKVRYFPADIRFQGQQYFCGILISMGEIKFQATAHDIGKISVVPPVEAWKEYQVNVVEHAGAKEGISPMNTWDFSCTDNTHPCNPPHGDTDAVDEYPGDGGYHTSTGCYNFYYGRDQDCDGDFNDDEDGDLGGGTKKALSFKGYIYGATGFVGGGSVKIHGAVAVATGGIFNGGGCDIYYDDMLEVKMLNDNITKVSWYEVTPVEF